MVLVLGLHVYKNASAQRKILKGENLKHIDRWMLDYHVLKHRPRDSACRWQPEIVSRFLSSNSPPDVVEQILNGHAGPDRRGLVVLRLSCEPFVRDGKLHVSAHGDKSSRARLCDYGVDPLVKSPHSVRERWQEHTADAWQDHTADAEEQGSDHARQSGYVLGRSVHEFAPAVAALTDCEELVAPKTI